MRYEEKSKYIGKFKTGKDRVGHPLNSSRKVTATDEYQAFLNENYPVESGVGIEPKEVKLRVTRISSTDYKKLKEKEKDKTLDEMFNDFLEERVITQNTCFYRVDEISKRRKCTCPDGSPCRSTVKRDSVG